MQELKSRGDNRKGGTCSWSWCHSGLGSHCRDSATYLSCQRRKTLLPLRKRTDEWCRKQVKRYIWCHFSSPPSLARTNNKVVPWELKFQGADQWTSHDRVSFEAGRMHEPCLTLPWGWGNRTVPCRGLERGWRCRKREGGKRLRKHRNPWSRSLLGRNRCETGRRTSLAPTRNLPCGPVYLRVMFGEPRNTQNNRIQQGVEQVKTQ